MEGNYEQSKIRYRFREYASIKISEIADSVEITATYFSDSLL